MRVELKRVKESVSIEDSSGRNHLSDLFSDEDGTIGLWIDVNYVPPGVTSIHIIIEMEKP